MAISNTRTLTTISASVDAKELRDFLENVDDKARVRISYSKGDRIGDPNTFTFTAKVG